MEMNNHSARRRPCDGLCEGLRVGGMMKKNMNYKSKMVQHGEVLIVPVSKLPDGFKESFTGNKYIVGHSESGHFHTAVTVDPMTVYKPVGADSQDIYVRIKKSGGKVEHQKTFDRHETKTLEGGLYLVRPKKEFDLFAKMRRQVMD
jgi:hypothetical protein